MTADLAAAVTEVRAELPAAAALLTFAQLGGSWSRSARAAVGELLADRRADLPVPTVAALELVVAAADLELTEVAATHLDPLPVAGRRRRAQLSA